MQDFHTIEVLDDDGIVITDLDQHSESSTQIPAINSCYLQVEVSPVDQRLHSRNYH